MLLNRNAVKNCLEESLHPTQSEELLWTSFFSMNSEAQNSFFWTLLEGLVWFGFVLFCFFPQIDFVFKIAPTR